MTSVDLRRLIEDLRRTLPAAGVGVSPNDVWLHWKKGEASVAVRCSPGYGPAVAAELKKESIRVPCTVTETAVQS